MYKLQRNRTSKTVYGNISSELWRKILFQWAKDIKITESQEKLCIEH